MSNCKDCGGRLYKGVKSYSTPHWQTRRHQRWLAIIEGQMYISSHPKAWTDRQARLRVRLISRSWYKLSILQSRVLCLSLGVDEPVYRTVGEIARVMGMSSRTVTKLKSEAIEIVMAKTNLGRKVVGHD